MHDMHILWYLLYHVQSQQQLNEDNNNNLSDIDDDNETIGADNTHAIYMCTVNQQQQQQR